MMLLACQPTGGGKKSALSAGTIATPGANDPTPSAPAPGATTAVYAITAGTVTNANLYTKSSPGANNCTEVQFTVTSGGQPAKAVAISFSTASASGAKDVGKVEPETANTDDKGVVETNFCSGDEAGKFSVVAKNGGTSVNSGDITVTTKPVYALTFSKADITVHASTATASTTTTDSHDLGVVYLNLYDSGPNDCSFFRYKLTKAGQALPATVVRFTTQIDFPKGFKLATKNVAGTTGADTTTQHTYAYYDATSNSSGELVVPVCAGQELGSVLVSATYVDSDGGASTTQSPVIVIKSGVTSWLDMTLTYAQPDGHTLRGFLNTNSTDKHPFTVNLGSRNNGDAITDYSVFAASESGKVELANGGAVSPGVNTATFTVTAVNLQTDRPYAVTNYPGSSANTLCDAESLANNASADIPYPQLAKNWRSTLVYGVRGQEYFHDAYGDGKFHPGCTGFWDKNQNGIFDAGDVITADPFNDGTLHNECDWFIDLPSPFVDVNENGVYDVGIDHLIGDTYQAPNGKWDNDTIIWKYDYTPIYMGTSVFSMTHSTITNHNIGSYADPLGIAYFTSLYDRGVASTFPRTTYTLWGVSTGAAEFGLTGPAYLNYGTGIFYFFAHSVCGTPLPGDTSLAVTFEAVAASTFGDRALTAHFYTQPLDTIREPSRRLLTAATGASSAKINFDIVDHPAGAAGYPIAVVLNIDACTNMCTGDLKTPGYGCDGKTVKATLTADGDSLPQIITVPQAKTCICADNATFTRGACSCPSGTTNTNGTCN